MPEAPERYEIYSREADELLNRPPHWLLTFGTAIIGLGIVLILVVSYLISYPETTEATTVYTYQESLETSSTTQLYFQIGIDQHTIDNITIGQKVLIELDRYPESKHGQIIGSVTSISTEIDSDTNNIQVWATPTEIPNTIELEPYNTGQATIILQESTLFDRFWGYLTGN